MKKKLLCVSVALALAGCGGSDSNGFSGSSSSTGVLLDSPVAGIGYRTESKSGVTNEFGEYKYKAGETVTFFIGDLEFPPVTATGTVTPADMTGDPATLTNILQLLQSLDKDGNPDNGIAIHEGAAAAFAGSSLDFTSAAFDTDVLTPLGNIGSGLGLVSEVHANAHFAGSLQTQLLGSWVGRVEGGRDVLTFIDDTRYILIHESTNGAQLAGSVEYGTYIWDPSTGDFTSAVVSESDADGGLGGITSITVDAHTMTITYIDGDTDVEASMSALRVTSASNPLVGAWFMANPDDPASLDVITILSATEYVVAHTNNDGVYSGDTVQPLSGEFGTYGLSGRNFTVKGASVDTDGDSGLFDADGVGGTTGLVDVEDWGTLKFEEGVDIFALARIGQFSVELVDDPDGKGVDSEPGESMGTINVQRDVAGFAAVDVQDKSWRINVRFAPAYEAECLETFADGTCGSAFRFDLSAGGTGFAEEINEHAVDPAEGRWPATWSINSAGEIKVVFDAMGSGLEEEFFTATIAKLDGVNADGNDRVMLALEAIYEDTGEIFEEDSLWESVLTPIVTP